MRVAIYYFPRLQRDAARQLLQAYSGMPIDELVLYATQVSAQSYWYPTAPAGQHVSPEMLRAFQDRVRQIAGAHGYPTVLGEKDPERVSFDREVVAVILDLLPMLPAEAAQESVWSFLSLVVLPDVSLWRWPNTKEKDDYERILGYPRNVFRRLWWRAYTLGVGQGGVASLMREDEAVAIMERTTIGGNLQLSRCIAQTHVSRFQSSPKRTELMRDAMKRIRRLHAFVSFHSLTDKELEDLVTQAFDDAEASLLGRE